MSVDIESGDAGSGLGRWVDTVEQLVCDVDDGARISVSGFHFVRTPTQALIALAGRRNLHYIAWGGGFPLELLLSHGPETVTTATVCFASLDVLGPAPRFRAAVESGQLDLHEYTALGMQAGWRAAGENQAYQVIQEPAGSSLTPGFSIPLPSPFPPAEHNAPTVAVAPLDIDWFLLHAQRADDDGNVELCGGRGMDMPTAFAAKRIAVTVEERVPRGQLGAPRSFILPRTFVDRLCVAPGGAHPTSCLPYYPTDYRALRDLVDAGPQAGVPESVTTPDRDRIELQHQRISTAADRIARAYTTAAMAGDGKADPGHAEPDAGHTTEHDAESDAAAYTTDELIVSVIARTIGPDSICSFGSASPLPTAAYLLAKLRHPSILLMSHNGGLTDVPFRPLSLLASEYLDFELAAAHTGGDETYHWYYQRGLITHEVVGSAQVDGSGATNNLWVTSPSGRRIRLPGQGGMADVANLHANFMIYLPHQSLRNTVEKVPQTSAARIWHSAEQRRSYGLQPGRMAMVTDLAVFGFDESSGRLRVESRHPGTTTEQLREATGFPIDPTDAPVTPAPTADDLEAIRTLVDPLGVRRLDMVDSAGRQHVIDELLAREEQLLDALRQEGSP